MLDWIFRSVAWILTYAAVGGVAAFFGTFIGDNWRNPEINRWSLAIPILIMGVVIYHFPTVLAALASGSSDYY